MAVGIQGLAAGYRRQPEEEQEKPGLIGSLLREIGRDIKGSAKIVGAGVLAPLDWLGVNVPVSFDDITKRDVVGGLMVASGFLGGAIAQGARGSAAALGAVRAAPALRAAAPGVRAALPIIGNKAGQEAAHLAATKLNWLQNLAIVGASEAAAGAAFGAVRPLEDGESKLEAVIKEGALFGTFGAVGSTFVSAFRATVGKQLAIVKTQRAAAISQRGLATAEASQRLKEISGVKLLNPKSGEEGILRRHPESGRIYFETVEGRKEYPSFSTAFLNEISEGFTENLGYSKSEITPKILQDNKIDVDMLLEEGMLKADDERRIYSLTEQMDLKVYEGVRKAIDNADDAARLMESLQVENLVEYRDGLGQLSRESVDEIAKAVEKMLPRREFDQLHYLLKLDPSGSSFVRESIRRGVMSVQGFADSVELKNWMTEFAVNERSLAQSLGSVRLVANASYDASFLVKALTTNGVVKLHPELAPWRDMIDLHSAEHELAGSSWSAYTKGLMDRATPQKLSKVFQLMKENVKLGSFEEIHAATANAALRTGDAEIATLTDEMFNIFNNHKLRRVAKGLSGVSDMEKEDIQVARAYIRDMMYSQGDFVDFDSFAVEAEIRNMRGAKLTDEQRQAVTELLDTANLERIRTSPTAPGYTVRVGDAEIGSFSTLDQALNELKLTDREGIVTVLPNQVLDGSASRVLSADRIKAVMDRELQRGTLTLEPEVLEAVKKGDLTAMYQLKELNDLAHLEDSFDYLIEDPLRHLDFYGLQQESMLANAGMDEATEAFIARNVPRDKSVLRAFIRQKTAILQGRPTPEEQMIDNFFKRFGGEVNVFKLKKYSQTVRRVQSWAKLGGVWSGLVNSTQFAVNGGTKLGGKYTLEGLRVALSPTERKAFMKELAASKMSLGFHGSLSTESILSMEESIGPMIESVAKRWKLGNKPDALRAAREAAENIWMFSFNTAEKFNRLATAAGAYKQALDNTPGISKEAALEKAMQMVETTQFNYRSSNIPVMMQGPIGSVLFQFKSFFVNEMEFIAGLNQKERVRFASILMAAGGASSLLELPGVDIVDGASKLFFDAKLSEALKFEDAKAHANDEGVLKRAITRFAAFGAPGFAHIDITNYIGPGSLSDFTRGFLGPTGSDTKAFIEFMSNAVRDVSVTGSPTEDTVFRFFRQVMPSQVRRFNTGRTIISQGEVRNPYTGKLLYKPDKRVREGIFAGIGFPRIEESTQRALDDYLQRATDNYRGVRESYRKQIALAQIRGDSQKANSLLARAAASGISFTPQDVRRAVESFSLNAEERRRLRTPEDLRNVYLADFEGLLPTGSSR